jgi:hypothetical protein
MSFQDVNYQIIKWLIIIKKNKLSAQLFLSCTFLSTPLSWLREGGLQPIFGWVLGLAMMLWLLIHLEPRFNNYSMKQET